MRFAATIAKKLERSVGIEASNAQHQNTDIPIPKQEKECKASVKKAQPRRAIHAIQPSARFRSSVAQAMSPGALGAGPAGFMGLSEAGEVTAVRGGVDAILGAILRLEVRRAFMAAALRVAVEAAAAAGCPSSSPAVGASA